MKWSLVIHGLTSTGTNISADVSLVFWRWEACDPKVADGLERIPVYFYPTKPFNVDLRMMIRPGLTLADMSIREVEEALMFVFSQPLTPFPRAPKTAIEKLPPSRRQAAKEKLAETENILKTWRGDARSRG